MCAGMMVIGQAFLVPMAIQDSGFGIGEVVRTEATDAANAVVSREFPQFRTSGIWKKSKRRWSAMTPPRRRNGCSNWARCSAACCPCNPTASASPGSPRGTN